MTLVVVAVIQVPLIWLQTLIIAGGSANRLFFKKIESTTFLFFQWIIWSFKIHGVFQALDLHNFDFPVGKWELEQFQLHSAERHFSHFQHYFTKIVFVISWSYEMETY